MHIMLSKIIAIGLKNNHAIAANNMHKQIKGHQITRNAKNASIVTPINLSISNIVLSIF